jgi:hypothetical protein
MVGRKLNMASDASHHTKSAELSLKNELAGSSSPYVSLFKAIKESSKPLTLIVAIARQ